MTHAGFNEAAWVERLGAALEHVAAEARPSYAPLPPEMPRSASIDEYWSVLHRGYRDLAARAKHDASALRQFNDSFLWLDTDPMEASAVLREHPLLKPGLTGSGENERVRLTVLNRRFDSDVKGLVACLARLSVKEGGAEAARRLHRYLTAGVSGTLPAYEIAVVHGLVVKERFNLDAGAYLAPYEDARAEFGLPEEPEPLSKRGFPAAAVLVRSIEYGPGVAPPHDDDADLAAVRIAYRFPAVNRVDLESWFEDSRRLLDLLSIARGVPLLSRTHYVRVAGWIEEIHPSFAFGAEHSSGFVSDVRPRGRDFSRGDADAFAELARGWHTFPGKPDAMNLAIRRLAASFSRPGGRFGQEDRILDVAIALEVFYGGATGHKLAQRAAGLLEAGASAQKRTYDQATSFYRVRSSIVHLGKQLPSPDVLETELEEGRDLACHTLASLLSGAERPKWATVVRSLLPETRAHIKAVRSLSAK